MKSVKRLLIILAAAVCFGVLAWSVLAKPSLKQYQADYGFSLDGLKVKINRYYHMDAFQDPWSVYEVKVFGDTSGSIFDPQAMTDGIPLKIRDWMPYSIEAQSNANKTPVFEVNNHNTYRSRVLLSKRDPQHGAELFIIYDMDMKLYYVIHM